MHENLYGLVLHIQPFPLYKKGGFSYCMSCCESYQVSSRTQVGVRNG